nr:putative RNA-directed DNA polymerase, eukaryota, reverse transcriptase zinc-binding domain protein [Tanacetum cinerariifolium]
MVRHVTDMEIKAAMFDIGDDRAPGPDGYTSALFKNGRDIVGKDICNSVRDFFLNGKLLKEINHTFIALIPKVSTPLRVNDYRSILCCNVIYKCISKILTNRIIDGIKEVVSKNQSAFVPGRRRGICSCYFGALDEFKPTSGLVPIIPKSTAFFCNVPYLVKLSILNIMPFSKDRPFWDVPLKADVSWSWLKLLQLRTLVRPYIWVKLGNAPTLDAYTCDNVQRRDLDGPFSNFLVRRAWEALKPRGMEMVRPVFHDIVAYLQPVTNKRTDTKRTPEELRDVIMITVRLKLISFKFKNSHNVNYFLDLWKLPRSLRLYGSP